jgi:hypothetical protein
MAAARAASRVWLPRDDGDRCYRARWSGGVRGLGLYSPGSAPKSEGEDWSADLIGGDFWKASLPTTWEGR